MGMATRMPTKEPTLIADNLVICRLCGAQYDPTLEWILVRCEGTNTHGTQLMAVPKECCPVCLTKQSTL